MTTIPIITRYYIPLHSRVDATEIET